MQGLRVLLVDDSLLFRELLGKTILSYLPSGSQIEKAANPFEARDKILSFEPDVMLLDIEMPRMNGLEFLRRLLVQYKQTVIMLSSSVQYRESALAAGAVDFIVKPDGNILMADQKFFIDLAARICAMAGCSSESTAAVVRNNIRKSIIAMGASTGGTEALATVLKALRPPLPGIVVVQHIPPMFSRLFAERLETECALTVCEASNGDMVAANHVYIAPGDKQMRVKGTKAVMRLECFGSERVSGHCPSVDVLFDSVATVAGENALGVIMTGMGSDGARGLLKMRQAGADTIGQDERSCVVYGMPRVAWEIGAVGRQLPLSAIAGAVASMAGGGGRS